MAKWKVVISASAWGMLALALAAWIALLLTDLHWIGTITAFGPRWGLLVLVVVLAIPAAAWHRSALLPLALAAALIAVPVMGLCLPWGHWTTNQSNGNSIKVLTCNTLGGRAEESLKVLVKAKQPDVVVLQEWPSQRPLPVELAEGRELARAGGIVIASKLPILASERMESPARKGHVIGLRCELEIAGESVQLFGLHLLTPRKGLEAVLSERFSGLDELDEVTKQRQLDGMAVEAWMDRAVRGRETRAQLGVRGRETRAQQGSGDGSQETGVRSQGSGVRGQESGDRRVVPTLVAGDLNLTVESTIYRRRFGHLQNAFSTAGWGWGGTKFTRIHSVRIDHVLADENWRIERCEVGPDVGSDHRPVVAEVTLDAAGARTTRAVGNL